MQASKPVKTCGEPVQVLDTCSGLWHVLQAGRTAAAGNSDQDDAIQNASNAVIDLLARGDLFAGAPPCLMLLRACSLVASR